MARDAIYRLYAQADSPRLDELAGKIADDDELPGSPGKDLIRKILAGEGLGTQQDTVTVAVALAREASHTDTAAVAEQIRQLWLDAKTSPPPQPPPRLGRPVSRCDPLMLEVHPAIQVDDAGTDPLPTYLPRAHDLRLREVADVLVRDSSSRMVTLVGESSTGKTRACWELVLARRSLTRVPVGIFECIENSWSAEAWPGPNQPVADAMNAMRTGTAR